MLIRPHKKISNRKELKTLVGLEWVVLRTPSRVLTVAGFNERIAVYLINRRNCQVATDISVMSRFSNFAPALVLK